MNRPRVLLATLILMSTPAPSLAQGNDLAAQAAAAVEQVRASLPIRADDITTAVGIRADGTEFVYDMRLSQVVPAERIEEVQRRVQELNQTRMCEGDSGPFIRLGGSMRHIYTDPEGHRFETRVTDCPPAR